MAEKEIALVVGAGTGLGAALVRCFAAAGMDTDRSLALMKAVDRINGDWGRDTVRFAATGARHPRGAPWSMKQDMRSPCYTTRWRDLKRVGD